MENLPTHVAIVPDGNRRWAKLHGVSSLEGHRAGAETMHQVVDYLADRGIKYLTLWGFSTDNWKRNPAEIDDIFKLLKEWLDSHTAWAHSKGIRLLYLGRSYELPQPLREVITGAVELTCYNTGMTLTVAFNYSGRAEIIDAVRQMAEDNVACDLVNETILRSYLQSHCLPDVDLVIRTAGEFRISNFLLWQTAYSEFYFTPVLWPDFGREEIDRALLTYSERMRRFGGD